MNATLQRITSTIAAKPYTFACLAWQVGCFVAPVTTIVASVLYTGMHLGSKAADEWQEEIAKAIAARVAQKEAA